MSAETANDAYRAHSLFLNDRKTIKLTGITDVVSFDEESATFDSSFGGIEIGGTGLHVEVLNLKDGVVELTGQVDSISYFANEKTEKPRKGILEKIFR